jgi:uncharacterized protein (TIGR02117 family)
MPTALRTALLILAVLIVGTGCSATPVQTTPAGEEAARIVWVVSHGWHTGIIVRTGDIPEGAWPERVHYPYAAYLEVGWGDREFYPAPDPSIGDALRAALGPSATVLHVVGLTDHPTRVFSLSETITLEISEAGFERLIEFIAATHDRAGAERAEPIGPGLYLDSHFYPALGSFHLFNNCNTWVVNALRAAGLPLRWAMTSAGVIEQALNFGTRVPRTDQ